ncbi:hypothetical protein VTI28DRAFT_3875 [Corynascus sepedonium]
MAPSILRLGATALACASSTLALETYQLKESYNPSNFFDKFKFFSDPDPNQGFVNYRNEKDAADLGLVQSSKDEVTISVDAVNKEKSGRNSVRLESVQTYNSGLFIANFAHFPKPACGAWPAFWMVGPRWPQDGEVDIYEGWNLNTANKVVLHTDGPLAVGSCTIQQEDFTAGMRYDNCWYQAPGQPGNTGCAADQADGTFGSASGGVYATLWDKDSFKVWSWTHDNVPSDVTSGNPDPSKWDKPAFAAGGNSCDVTKAFKDMRMILNINFCGDAAGGLWGETCQSTTGVSQCSKYVQENPDAFKETYWKIRGIDVYQLETVKPSSTSTSSTATSTSTSSTSKSTSASSTSSSSSSTKSATSTTTTKKSTSVTETSTSEIPTGTATQTATETTTSTSSSESATETETESDCPDDNATSTTTTPPGVTGTSATATATETETESECSDDVSETATAEPTGSFTDVTGTASTTRFTTSTISKTVTSTITSCASTVTDCPARTVTTVIIIGTTVCPITEAEPTETATVIPTPGGPIEGGDTTLRTLTTVSKTTTVVIPRPTDDSEDGDEGDDDNNEDDEDSDDETNPSFVPSFVPSPSSTSVTVSSEEPEQAQPTDTGPGVPPVEIVTTANPSATATATTGSSLIPVVTAGAGKVGAGSAMLMGVGAVVALVNM